MVTPSSYKILRVSVLTVVVPRAKAWDVAAASEIRVVTARHLTREEPAVGLGYQGSLERDQHAWGEETSLLIISLISMTSW